MARTVAIGHQDFETIRTHDYFYVDKTAFVREWWSSGDSVTLITRPRRFGKTLNMSMLEQFFSLNYADRGDLFEGLTIWEDEEYQKIQGTYPVISLSFANVKETSFSEARKKICYIIEEQFNKCEFLLEGDLLNEKEKSFIQSVSANMEEYIATSSLGALSDYLHRYYGKKVIILLDEYDTPLQEAYVYGYWEEMVPFIKSFFNATFKTNPHLERAVMTGITRVSKESIFSDLNNLEVVTTTSTQYEEAFGFTEEEVFAALDECGLSGEKQNVKAWYDGFQFGDVKDIYNPWSIINYLDKKELKPYWANTSANSLAGKLIREGSQNVKQEFEELLQGGTLTTEIDEQIVYNQLGQDESAVWGLLLASGYLRVVSFQILKDEYCGWRTEYVLELTNFEVKIMFRNMIRSWFGSSASDYNEFIKALLKDDVKAMNAYMNRVARDTFSYFDTGRKPSKDAEPEKFYHGFVLGLMVDLTGRYAITSNRESGFGRYDVMLESLKTGEDAMILEFKVHDPEDEKDLEETAQSALAQIREKEYAASLAARGIPLGHIRSYGFAFEGKKVLIRKGD